MNLEDKHLHDKLTEFGEAEVRELAIAALKIGYTFGKEYTPIVQYHAGKAAQLDMVETILGEYLPDGLYTWIEHAEELNAWRELMGDELVPDDEDEDDDESDEG